MVDRANLKKSEKPRKRFFYFLVQLFVYTIFKVLFGLRIYGRANVPETGSFILASNHQSWFDPPILGASCPRELHYAAKRELFDMFILGKIVRYFNSIPIRRSGFDRTALLKLAEILRDGNAIIIFPEGKRFKDDRLHPAKAGVGMLASQNDAPIIPCYITGSRKLRWQIIKRKLCVKIGKPFRIKDLNLNGINGKDVYRMIADEVMVRIAKLGSIEAPV